MQQKSGQPILDFGYFRFWITDFNPKALDSNRRIQLPHIPAIQNPKSKIQNPKSSELFGNRLRLHKQQEIILPSAFRIGAGHVEPTERVGTDHRTSALAIQIQVSNVELSPGFLESQSLARVDRAGQAVLSVIGDVNCVIKALRRRSLPEIFERPALLHLLPSA